MTTHGAMGAAAALLISSTGCILPAMDVRRTGHGLSPIDGRSISEGRVTKGDLFDELGPPMAIVEQGEVRPVPAANVHHLDVMGRGRGSYTTGGGSWLQQADAWFEPFRTRRTLRDSHRVYYWYATSEGGVTVVLLFTISSRHSSMAELWALVDEESGKVEDAIFRER